MKRLLLLVTVALLALGASVIPAMADGDQMLGPPTVGVSPGTGIATGGTGLAATGSGVIGVSVPDGAAVEQVLLYWTGQYYRDGSSDSTLVVDGTEVTGTLIGTSFHFTQTQAPNQGRDIMSDTFRADITDLVGFGPGANSVAVSGATFEVVSDGAGVIVIYDAGGDLATIDVRDGNDGAFFGFPEPRQTTIAQTFVFPASTEQRTAQVAMLVSSVNDQFGDDDFRPNVVLFSGGVTTQIVNPFGDHQGDHFDAQMIEVMIPAGATELTVQVGSADPDATGFRPASLFWNAAGLSIAAPPPDDPGCTRTLGYWQTHSSIGPAKYDSTWDARAGGSAPFFGTGLSYIQALQASSAGGNAYLMLAQQYIAAELNMLAGADLPTEVAEAMSSAASMLTAYERDVTIPKRTADRADALALAEILDDFNNGLTGPGHCD